MPRVIISSGHTSNSPGTIANGLREFDVARKISKATLPFLRSNGVITLSVPPNLPLVKRIDWINKTGYREDTQDIALEIHINDGGDTGIEVWYEGDGGNKSEELAQSLLDNVNSETQLKKQGIKSEYEHDLGSLAFIHDTNTTSCIIECGYIDNKDDADFLRDDKNIEKIGKGIAKAILKFLGIEYKDPKPKQAPKTNMDNSTTTSPPTFTPPPTVTTPVPPTPDPVAQSGLMPPTSPVTSGFNGGNFNSPSTFGGSSTPPSFGGGANTGAGGFKPLPSRDERREMINNYYIKILGREPNQNDLNYFLNIGITEDQLIKKMIDSQEHADLVKARQEILKTKKEAKEQQSELEHLRTQVNDTQKILTNMQNSIDQKNHALSEMQSRINNFQRIQAARDLQPKQQSSEAKYKGSFLDKLFRAFSDVFE